MPWQAPAVRRRSEESRCIFLPFPPWLPLRLCLPRRGRGGGACGPVRGPACRHPRCRAGRIRRCARDGGARPAEPTRRGDRPPNGALTRRRHPVARHPVARHPVGCRSGGFSRHRRPIRGRPRDPESHRAAVAERAAAAGPGGRRRGTGGAGESRRRLAAGNPGSRCRHHRPHTHAHAGHGGGCTDRPDGGGRRSGRIRSRDARRRDNAAARQLLAGPAGRHGADRHGPNSARRGRCRIRIAGRQHAAGAGSGATNMGHSAARTGQRRAGRRDGRPVLAEPCGCGRAADADQPGRAIGAGRPGSRPGTDRPGQRAGAGRPGCPNGPRRPNSRAGANRNGRRSGSGRPGRIAGAKCGRGLGAGPPDRRAGGGRPEPIARTHRPVGSHAAGPADRRTGAGHPDRVGTDAHSVPAAPLPQAATPAPAARSAARTRPLTQPRRHRPRKR